MDVLPASRRRPGLSELRLIMAEIRENSSTATPADDLAAAPSPASEDLAQCLHDLDRFSDPALSKPEDCTLECSYCAVRWSARRILAENEP